MVYVLAKLKIEDYDMWKPVFDERKSLRKEAGSKEGTLYRNSDNSNELIIFFDWEDMEKAKKFFQSESLQKALEKGGAELIETTYLEKIEKAT
jgi:quinol monooxygenase YgiN